MRDLDEDFPADEDANVMPLAHRTPQSFNQAVRHIVQQSYSCAGLSARYSLAALAAFPSDQLQENFPRPSISLDTKIGDIQNNTPALVSAEGFWPATAVVLSEIISYFPQFVDATCSLPGLLSQDTQLQSLSKPRLPSAQAIVQFRGGADADDDAGCLLRSSPLEFNQAFEKLFHADPDRARLIVRYILADLVPFPVEAVEEQLPEVFRMTDTLAQKAGCPFEWAFLLFLPVLGTACAKARLFINEFFLVPPLLWLGLCLDSGANKSGIMTAMADIVGLWLEAALSAAREEAEAQEAAEEAFAEPDESAQKRRKVALSKSLAQIQQNKPALFSDVASHWHANVP